MPSAIFFPLPNPPLVPITTPPAIHRINKHPIKKAMLSFLFLSVIFFMTPLFYFHILIFIITFILTYHLIFASQTFSSNSYKFRVKYITKAMNIFLFHKKVQSPRFAMCTTTVRAFSYSIKKCKARALLCVPLLYEHFPIP